MPHSGRFERADRVVSPRDYRRLRRNVRRFTSKNFAVSVAPRQVMISGARHGDRTVANEGRRLGITVSRRVGNAVVRNRVKRSIREWFRQFRSSLDQNIDIVVVARGGAANRKTNQIFSELRSLLENPGLAQVAGSDRDSK